MISGQSFSCPRDYETRRHGEALPLYICFNMLVCICVSFLPRHVLLLLLLQVLIDATNRPEFAVLDLTGGQSGAAVIADMPLDASRQHVYAVTATRVSIALNIGVASNGTPGHVPPLTSSKNFSNSLPNPGPHNLYNSRLYLPVSGSPDAFCHA